MDSTTCTQMQRAYTGKVAPVNAAVQRFVQFQFLDVILHLVLRFVRPGAIQTSSPMLVLQSYGSL
jgi:hypothetical protein